MNGFHIIAVFQDSFGKIGVLHHPVVELYNDPVKHKALLLKQGFDCHALMERMLCIVNFQHGNFSLANSNTKHYRAQGFSKITCQFQYRRL